MSGLKNRSHATSEYARGVISKLHVMSDMKVIMWWRDPELVVEDGNLVLRFTAIDKSMVTIDDYIGLGLIFGVDPNAITFGDFSHDEWDLSEVTSDSEDTFTVTIVMAEGVQ